MSHTSRIFYHKKIYNVQKTDALFVKSILENVNHHQKNCLEYAQILEHSGFKMNDIVTIEDLYKIPPIPTLFFKRHTLLSTQKRLFLKSTTSGTSGKVSEMGLDLTSAWNGLGMVLGTFFANKLVSPRPTNYIILGYQPAKRNKIGAVKTAYAVTFAAPALHRTYALKDTGKEYILNLDGIIASLQKYEKSGHPVRFMGFPAYFLFLLKELESANIKLKLHPKSMVILAGGWKQFFTEQVDKPELYARAKSSLDVDETRIREFFGAVEHPIAYFDCPNHHFHVPIYSRVIIRDTQLNPVGYGTPGLLNLITPMMVSMPFTSVLTDDLAVLHPGEECGCGIHSPYFEVLGRVGISDIKTCAAGASELLSIIGNGGTK